MEANLEQSPLPKPEEHPPDAKEPFQKPKLLPVLAVILFASIVVLLAYSVRQRYQSANQLSPIPSPIPPTPTQNFSTGISGKVTLGPMCPVMRVGDTSCADKPYQATISVLDANRTEITRVTSDANGKFLVNLPPGTYELDGLPSNYNSPFPRPGKATVTVVQGQMTQVTISYDTGIR